MDYCRLWFEFYVFLESIQFFYWLKVNHQCRKFFDAIMRAVIGRSLMKKHVLVCTVGFMPDVYARGV